MVETLTAKRAASFLRESSRLTTSVKDPLAEIIRQGLRESPPLEVRINKSYVKRM